MIIMILFFKRGAWFKGHILHSFAVVVVVVFFFFLVVQRSCMNSRHSNFSPYISMIKNKRRIKFSIPSRVMLILKPAETSQQLVQNGQIRLFPPPVSEYSYSTFFFACKKDWVFFRLAEHPDLIHRSNKNNDTTMNIIRE